jgi:electron transport complex protein RnfG
VTSHRESFLAQSWLVLLLALIFGGTLAGVHVGLAARIEANRRAETLARIPELILGDRAADAGVEILDETLRIALSEGSVVEMRVAERKIADHQVFEVTRQSDGERLGWVARGSGQGYADLIEVLVGLDPAGQELTGMYVLNQKETPALGDGITKAPFRKQFVGAATDRLLTVVKSAPAADADPSQVLALTAATISSQSVCDIVNKTVVDIKAEIEGR